MLAVLLLNRMTGKGVSKRQKVLHPTIVNVYSEKPHALCCRTCLGTQHLQPIFTNKDTEKKTSHHLKLVTGLNIKMNDGLSQNICQKCVKLLTTALQFRRSCRKAEKALLQISSTKKQERNYNIKKKEEILKNDNIKYESYQDCQNDDDFQNDCSFYDTGLQNESFNDVKEKKESSLCVEEKSDDKKPIVRGRRSKLPNASSYKCPICHKEFKMKATYKAHLRFHTNYCVCETCGKRCRNNHQLQEHKRARHGLGRIHKCAYCEYSSATKEALTIHERRHTGERPYVCDHCGATFHRRSNLVQHIAIHLPEKNFQCDLCPKRLKSRKFLQIHKHNAHTGRKYGYLCPVCEHRFEKPNKVRVHTRRVHGLQDGDHPPIVRVQL